MEKIKTNMKIDIDKFIKKKYTILVIKKILVTYNIGESTLDNLRGPGAYFREVDFISASLFFK